jgi:hypothetical protein
LGIDLHEQKALPVAHHIFSHNIRRLKQDANQAFSGINFAVQITWIYFDRKSQTSGNRGTESFGSMRVDGRAAWEHNLKTGSPNGEPVFGFQRD